MTNASVMRFLICGAQHEHVVSMARGLVRAGWTCAAVTEALPDAIAAPLANELSCPLISDPAPLLNSGTINLVVTASINAQKPDCVVAALSAGIDVFADKPLAVDMAGLQRIHAAAANGRNVWAWFSLRYEPASHLLRKMILDGDIGRPLAVEAVRPHRLSPASRPDWMFDDSLYGGVLNDLVCHDIDLYLWLTDALPEWIAATEYSTRFPSERGSITDLALVMTGGSGAAGCFRGDWLTPGRYPAHGDCRFRVVGTEGTAEIRWAGPTLDPGPPDIVLYSDRSAPVRIDPAGFPVPDLFQELTDCISMGRPMILTSSDVFRSTSLTLLARESARSGRTVRDLSRQILS
ncbi:MAG: Gfo/Idh/MocA family oxidoreductase [Planctomycetes bacterium]|nr:Gfo/Idh/MocA family oxidoreductase [Planctomycetota bacterium]